MSLKTLISATASYSDAASAPSMGSRWVGSPGLASQKSETKSLQTYVRESRCLVTRLRHFKDDKGLVSRLPRRRWHRERPAMRWSAPPSPSRVRTSRIPRIIISLILLQLHISDTQERREGHRVTRASYSTAALYTVSFSRACVRPCFSYSVRSAPHKLRHS